MLHTTVSRLVLGSAWADDKAVCPQDPRLLHSCECGHIVTPAANRVPVPFLAKSEYPSEMDHFELS